LVFYFSRDLYIKKYINHGKKLVIDNITSSNCSYVYDFDTFIKFHKKKSYSLIVSCS
jgi:hypothetical protein